MPRRDEGREEQVRQLVAEHEASGLSVMRFARGRGITPWRLYDFKRRARVGTTRPAATGGFVRVKLIEPRPAASTMAVEIQSGLRVHVACGFDANELRRLIGVLSSC